MSQPAARLLRRFELPPQASLAQLKEAYKKQAKVLHPDVAGPASEDRFRRLKEDYEEAAQILRRKAVSGTWGNPSQRAQTHRTYRAYQGGAYSAYQNQSYTWQTAGASAQAAPPEPLTPAQRLRNAVVLGTSGVLVALFMLRPATQRESPAARLNAGNALDPTMAVAARPLQQQPRPPVLQPVSDYYKKRTSKSSVRVRSTDVYVSPVEVPKSRAAEEGLGSTAAAVSSVARGRSPSESRVTKSTENDG